MIHFTCDICRKEMVVGDRDRYVLHIEIRPAKPDKLTPIVSTAATWNSPAHRP